MTESFPNWQPIETAPMDGTIVIIACVKPNFLVGPGGAPLRYVDVARVIPGDHRGQMGSSPWQTAWSGQFYQYAPTHWMPLPEAPTLEVVEEEMRAREQDRLAREGDAS